MNFHHLRYFLTITRRGGFTQAARELNVTQPTVSSGIAELERNLGVKLFNRDSRHVNLTPQGRTLVSYAEQIEDLLEEAGQRLSGDVMPDGFRFGAIDAAVIYLLPDILKRYLDSYPELDLSIQVEPSHYLVESLLTNRSEFALISLPLDNPKVQTISLCSDDMPLVVGAGHHLAGPAAITPAQISQETLILFHPDSVSRHIVDERFAEAGVAPRIVMEMRSPEAMRKLVEAGVGVSFLPRMTVHDALEAGSLCAVPVDGMSFEREIGLAWRRGRYFGPTIRDLIELILEAHSSLDAWRPTDPSASLVPCHGTGHSSSRRGGAPEFAADS